MIVSALFTYLVCWKFDVTVIWSAEAGIRLKTLVHCTQVFVHLKSEQCYVGFFFLMSLTLLLCVLKAYEAWCRAVDQFWQWADHPAAGFHTSSRKWRYSRLGGKVRRMGFRTKNSISAWYVCSCKCTQLFVWHMIMFTFVSFQNKKFNEWNSNFIFIANYA